MTNVFIIRPFGKKRNTSGKKVDFERVHNELIEPALKAVHLHGRTTTEIVDAGNIRDDMFALILEADLVICDITIHNANVFYELGIRHALRKNHTILIKGEAVEDSPPFDVLTDRYRSYNADNPSAARANLIKTIEATLQSNRETDSPVFRYLATLPEANPSIVQVPPADFREEVERALAAQSKGWLRLLAHDLHGRRFQWAGFQLVADAQRKLKDYDGARASLEEVRKRYKDDVATNLILANIYERLYRSEKKQEKKQELLKASDQMIERVITHKEVLLKDRAEALALQGRNQKTRWRHMLENLTTVEERRRAAMNQELRKCYESYLSAFELDLNHFYSGLNALQMGTIFLDLSEGGGDWWKASFDNDRRAEEYRARLAVEVKELRVVVPFSVEAARKRLSPKDQEWVWNEVSLADLVFLVEDDNTRVIQRYKDALPKENFFAWDAAKGQLQLFADLGIKAPLANVVISTVNSQFTERDPTEEFHIVLFAGHRVDAPGRPKPRFPADRESRAAQLIRTTLSRLSQGKQLVGLASAAPGADILFHEICTELKISSKLCLPMPAKIYTPLTFQNLDTWRSRFFKLREQKEVLELSDREGLPNWLHDASTDSWERGNRWVLEMALASGARSITLVALWDGQDKGDAPGGTANMVKMAQEKDGIDFEIIKTEQL